MLGGNEGELERATIYDYCCVRYITPLGRFPMVDVSTVLVGIVSVPKWSAWETSRRELSEDVSFGIDTLLVFEQSTLKGV